MEGAEGAWGPDTDPERLGPASPSPTPCAPSSGPGPPRLIPLLWLRWGVQSSGAEEQKRVDPSPPSRALSENATSGGVVSASVCVGALTHDDL